MINKSSIECYTDGSGKKTGPGGYCGTINIIGIDEPILIMGCSNYTTVHRMELFALTESLRFIRDSDAYYPGCSVNWYCDSKSVVDAVNNPEQRKQNGDLWAVFEFLTRDMTVNATHISRDNDYNAHKIADMNASTLFKIIQNYETSID